MDASSRLNQSLSIRPSHIFSLLWRPLLAYSSNAEHDRTADQTRLRQTIGRQRRRSDASRRYHWEVVNPSFIVAETAAAAVTDSYRQPDERKHGTSRTATTTMMKTKKKTKTTLRQWRQHKRHWQSSGATAGTITAVTVKPIDSLSYLLLPSSYNGNNNNKCQWPQHRGWLQ